MLVSPISTRNGMLTLTQINRVNGVLVVMPERENRFIGAFSGSLPSHYYYMYIHTTVHAIIFIFHMIIRNKDAFLSAHVIT